MYSLAQSARVMGDAGTPLPTVWQSLADAGIIFRRGELVLIAAGPGTAKSALTLTQALKSMIPSYIFSADSNAYTQLSRGISILMDWDMESSSKEALKKDLSDEVMETMSAIPLRLDYEAAPSIDHMEQQLESYWELFGEYPAIIVVDNVTNVDKMSPTDGDPFSGLEGLMDYLHTMARNTGACVFALHHVNGEYSNGDKPIPLNGIKGQIHRVPEMVLTIWKPEPGVLGVSKVKLRGGEADQSGETWVPLRFEGKMMQITDMDYGVGEIMDERRMYEEIPL